MQWGRVEDAFESLAIRNRQDDLALLLAAARGGRYASGMIRPTAFAAALVLISGCGVDPST